MFKNNKEFYETLQKRLIGDRPYEVGYGKPPKATQFKKGQSGNPAGRKKKVIPASIRQALELELTNKMLITNEKGKQENVYLFQILVKQIIKDALAKDGASRKVLLESLMKFDLLSNKRYLEEHQIKTAEKEQQDQVLKEMLIEKLGEAILEES